MSSSPASPPRPPGPADDPGGWADRDATARLLRCWVRETGAARPAGGVLRLPLPASGTVLTVPVEHWSPAGWHRFGPARLATGTPAPAAVVAALLALEASGGDPAATAELTGRVTDSALRVAEFVRLRSAAPDDPPGTTAFLAAEQALLTGHPFHPAPKSREGLTGTEAERFSPEARGAFPLHWFAADPRVVAADSALGRSAAELLAALPGAPAAPPGTVLLPAHPWQARDVRGRPGVRALLAGGLLHDLGPAGPEWSPTSSVRTLYRADAPVMLKLSLGLRITNSRRENLRPELRRGVAVARLLAAGLGAQLAAAHPGFGLVRDPAWLAVDAPDGSPTGLDAVLRENPFRPGAAQAECVAGLVAPRPDLPGGGSRLSALVHARAGRTGRTVAEAAEEWFLRYLDHVVAPVLWLHARYGLGLEAHQQNTLVVLDRDGLPCGGRYRDNQGYYFSPSRSPALYRWMPGVGRDLGTQVADEVIDERLVYYLGVNNLLGLVGALGSQGLAREERLLGHARRFLADRAAGRTADRPAGGGADRVTGRVADPAAGPDGAGSPGAAEEPGDSPAALLARAPELRCKANLLTRVHGLDELTGPLESQSVYVGIPNPIAEVTQ
ncbi:siderophore biosynthesis protein [Streptomyces sp. LP05-1]|uniref:Siderophore biosynthesis protein n=1 Tax=Streptomyces pyxinae TaxID=2970734 RepID=A0ABT2CDA6_9ACTN|nr:IucA/IucC family protein [Streptomyces sp. LP05-1]MCS0635396.1 siderophore biosynthesis protein [Streptomyces sp. LP05-1]